MRNFSVFFLELKGKWLVCLFHFSFLHGLSTMEFFINYANTVPNFEGPFSLIKSKQHIQFHLLWVPAQIVPFKAAELM